MEDGLEVQTHWPERCGSYIELAQQYKTQKKQIQKHKVPKRQFLLAVSLVSFEILFFVNTNVTEAQA